MSAPQLNPFLYGRPVPPKRFVGRRDALRTIFSRIHTGQSTSVTGAPHIGKSSFLQYVRDEAVRREWLGTAAEPLAFVDVDCHMLPASYGPDQFWSYILDHIERSCDDREILAQVAETRRGGYLSFALRRLFDMLSRAQRRVIVLVDEFDVLLHHARFNTADFFGALRALSVASDSLALVAASRMSTAEMNRRSQAINPLGSPFFNNLTEVHLRPLQPAEVDALIDRMLEGTPVRFEPADRFYITRMTGRHPFLVQLAAATLFEAAASGVSGPPRYAEVSRALGRVGAFHFEDMWRHLGPPLHAPLRALARAEFHGEAAALEAFAPELRSLEDAELVEAVAGAGSGRLPTWRGERWRITAKVFAQWVADHAPAPERDDNSPSPATIRQRMLAAFSLDELRTLCHDLGFDAEDLPAETREALAREIVRHCASRDLLDRLVAHCRTLRPNLPW